MKLAKRESRINTSGSISSGSGDDDIMVTTHTRAASTIMSTMAKRGEVESRNFHFQLQDKWFQHKYQL